MYLDICPHIALIQSHQIDFQGNIQHTYKNYLQRIFLGNEKHMSYFCYKQNTVKSKSIGTPRLLHHHSMVQDKTRCIDW